MKYKKVDGWIDMTDFVREKPINYLDTPASEEDGDSAKFEEE